MARSRATSVKESIDYIESVVKEITSSEKALTKAKVHCERKINLYESNQDLSMAKIYSIARLGLEKKDLRYFKMVSVMKRYPPTFEEMLESNEFLGGSVNVWAKIKEQCIQNTPHIFDSVEAPNLIIDNSTLGTGKSMSVILSMLYTLVTLECFNPPHYIFNNIDPATPIILYLISARPNITKAQLYQPLRDLVDSMPFFKGRYNTDMSKSIEMLNKVQMVQAQSNNPNQFLSLAIIRAVMDEANFFEHVTTSKRAGYGEREFDQAEKIYEALQSRYTSRFGGCNLGGLIVCSSPLHENDFVSKLHTKLNAGQYKMNYRYILNRQWDVKPLETFEKDGWFYFTPQNEKTKAGFYYDSEPPQGAYKVPMMFEPDFSLNPVKAQRDHLGIRTTALSPFIKDIYTVSNAVRTDDYGCTTRQDYILALGHGYPSVDLKKLINPKAPRFIHLDLSLTGDRAGIAMVHIGETVYINGQPVPTIYTDFAISVTPTEKNRIRIHEIRSFIEKMSEEGINIAHVSSDRFQSEELRGILMDKGIPTSLLSVDRNEEEPYQQLRLLFEQQRITIPDNELLVRELQTLEEVVLSKGRIKVDHSPSGSKDVSDALCGATFSALQSALAKLIIRPNLVSSVRDPEHSFTAYPTQELGSGFARWDDDINAN